MDLTSDKLESIANRVAALVEDAGKVAGRRPTDIGSELNPTTDLDRSIATQLERGLRDVLPLTFVQEEDPSSPDHPHWLVDPLDGTLNAVSGSPDLAVSVALMNDSTSPMLGVVHLPLHRRTFRAIKTRPSQIRDGEAWVDIQRHVPRRDIIAIGLNECSREDAGRLSEQFRRLLSSGFIFRQSGSAALDIVRVASGVWSGFAENGLKAWDIAAADLIARQAGCVSVVRGAIGPALDAEFALDYAVGCDAEMLASITSALGWDVSA